MAAEAGNLLYDRLFASGDAAATAISSPTGVLRYGDLHRGAARFANVLIGLGVTPGARVAVQVEKSASAVLLYLATLRVGAVYLPLNTAYTAAEVAYFIGDAEPALVVCDPAAIQATKAVSGAAAVETLDRAGQGSIAALSHGCPETFETVSRGADDLAAICYTSGTTGRSKGAMLTHRALTSNAETLVDLWRFTDQDALIHALPLYHVHGLFVATHVALMAGGSMTLLPKFDPAAVITAMTNATALMGIPTFYSRLLDHPGLTRDAVASMRLFISGSAPLLPQTHAEWTRRTGKPILERYGMTETGMNTSNPYEGERVAGSVGRPLPGVELRIASPDTGHSLSRGEIGVIEVKGPNVCAGYWRNPEKTAAAFRPDGFFITGDLGVEDERGYITIVGRGSDLVISGGLNVYPKEVETQIDALPGVVESAVIGLPHRDLGEAVTAVVAVGQAQGVTEQAVLEALGPQLARFKHPKRVILVPDLPRNAMGKVQKAQLRQTYLGLYQ